jgi:hypothetical protein
MQVHSTGVYSTAQHDSPLLAGADRAIKQFTRQV